VFAVFFGNCLYGTIADTGAAIYARVTDFMGHDLPLKNRIHHNIIQKMYMASAIGRYILSRKLKQGKKP
jgi:hypothetical protein